MQQYNKMIQKIIDFDNVTKENIKELDLNQPRIPDHSYRILIIRGFGSGKRISLFNYSIIQLCNLILIKMNYTLKYTFLTKKRECTGLKNFNDAKAFIKNSNDGDDICKNIEEYDPNKNALHITHSSFALPKNI